MKAACYLRVSTGDQDEQNQREDVERLCRARGWEPEWFIDHGLTGRTTDRSAYQAVMRAARSGKVKAVVVWKLDRLGRTVRQLVVDLDNLGAWGVDMVSVHDPVDTTTPMGVAMFQLAAVFAELESNNISMRTKASYKARKARAENLGKRVRWGRKRAEVPPEAVEAARGGLSQRQIAERCGISRRVAAYAQEVARNGGAVDEGVVSPDETGGS